VGLQWGTVNNYKTEPSSVTCVNMVTGKKKQIANLLPNICVF
jgi:hypothetical protein